MKHPDYMTVEECRDEVFNLESYFDMCRREGQGVSSKDTIRHRLCQFKVKYYNELGGRLELGQSVQEFMDNGHLMFAPVDCPCYVCDLYRTRQEV